MGRMLHGKGHFGGVIFGSVGYGEAQGRLRHINDGAKAP